jgi:hydroxymethylbilane synthase
LKPVLRIVSRESPLAMWQACHVRDRLSHLHPDLDIRILGIKTEADKFLDNTLASLGGKGAFVKELEQALLENHADLAVHSMKDVTVELPTDLAIAAILSREDPGDAFVSNPYPDIEALPQGATVGTSSLRRHCQLLAFRPDLNIKDIRGNVGTRLQKLDQGEYDALVLASAGLIRLGLDQRIRQRLESRIMLPAIAQGALGIEIRSNDPQTRELIAPLNDVNTMLCVNAERRVNYQLAGGCHAPIAAHATINQQTLTITALVGRLDGTEILHAAISGPVEQAEQLGDNVGRQLLDQGAGRILDDLRRAGSL